MRLECLTAGALTFALGSAIAADPLPASYVIHGMDDLVRMIAFAIDNPDVRGPLNGVAPNAVRNSDFTKALGSALGRPAILPLPAFAAKMVLGEMAEVVLGSARVSPKAPVDAGFRFDHPDLAAALRSVV